MDEFVFERKKIWSTLGFPKIYGLQSPATMVWPELAQIKIPQTEEAQEIISLWFRGRRKSRLALLDFILNQLKQEQLKSGDKKENVQLRKLFQKSINTLQPNYSPENPWDSIGYPRKIFWWNSGNSWFAQVNPKTCYIMLLNLISQTGKVILNQVKVPSTTWSLIKNCTNQKT